MRNVRLAIALVAAIGTISAGVQWGTDAPARAASVGAELAALATLGPGDSLDASSGGYQLLMAADGNLVEYSPDGSPVWQTGTDSPGASLLNGADGNLSLVATDGTVVWSTTYDPARGSGPLVLQDDGNLVLYGTPGHDMYVTYATPGGARTPAQGAALFALAQVGKPYVWGTAGPNTYDNPGLTLACYAVVNVALPHNTGLQLAVTAPISRSALRPGDLVFYLSGATVAIYIGNDQVISAGTVGDRVRIRAIDFTTISSYGRVLTS